MSRVLLFALLLALGLAGAPAAASGTWLFFSHAERGGGDCAAVFPVRRPLPSTRAVAAASLQALFAGPTPEEQAAGYRSPFSPATAGLLKRIWIRQGTAYLDLHDLREPLATASSSCGAAELRAQIDRTLLQFPSVRRVRIAIDGDPRRFHEWLGGSCTAREADCDPRPFRP